MKKTTAVTMAALGIVAGAAAQSVMQNNSRRQRKNISKNVSNAVRAAGDFIGTVSSMVRK